MKSLREKVYSSLKNVPRGKVTTYKDLAKAAGSKAYRAVGMLMRTNHDPKSIPCYKVIRSDGGIGNYSAAGGVKKKIALLKKDSIEIVNKKIDLKKYRHRFG